MKYPGELSCENLIFSPVKITSYLHMWKYHCCYGFIINRAFHTKKLLKWNGLVLHWCLYNNWNITWPLGDTKFLFSCWKNISLIHCAHLWNIFKEKFRFSARPCNILYLSKGLISLVPNLKHSLYSFPLAWTSWNLSIICVSNDAQFKSVWQHLSKPSSFLKKNYSRQTLHIIHKRNYMKFIVWSFRKKESWCKRCRWLQ